jgi:hypothetical protein
LKALLLMALLTAGSAAAQEANEVFLDATYLGAPTDWCPAAAGVALVVTMEGPNIVEVSAERPKSMTVRRGSSREEFAFGSKKFDETAPVIGRLSAEFRDCQSPWKQLRWAVRWRVTASDGAEIDSGTVEEYRNSFRYFAAVKRLFNGHRIHSSEIRYIDFGDRVLFTKGPPEATFTQTFAAEAYKE